MCDDLTVIYAARSMQQAHLLKNLLARVGIKAVVTNDVLEGGAGVDVLGWATLARVAVARHDAGVARRIALDFDAKSSYPPDDGSEETRPAERVDEQHPWPRCPQCGARRPTVCGVCQTAGTDFPLADADFVAPPGVADDAQPLSCGCGSGGCSTHGSTAAEDARPEEEDARPEDTVDETQTEAEAPPRMLMCPTCDEPFVPEYPRRCEWCGHEFDDGFDPDARQLIEPISRRAIAVIFTLLALLAALLVYFMIIV